MTTERRNPRLEAYLRSLGLGGEAPLPSPIPPPPPLTREVPQEAPSQQQARQKAIEAGQERYFYAGEWKNVKATLLDWTPLTEQISEVAPFRQIGEVMESPEAERIKEVLSLIGTVGAIGTIGYVGITSIGPITQEIRGRAFQTLLNKGLDKWIANRSRGVPPQHFRRAQDALYNFLYKNKISIQERATENMVRRMGRTANRAEAVKQAVDDTITEVDASLTNLVPRATQTGALAFGGKAPPPIPPPPIEPTLPAVPPTVPIAQGVTPVEAPAVPVPMPLEVQQEMITRGQSALDILPPEVVKPNSIISVRNGFVGTDSNGKAALVIQVNEEEGGKLVAGNVVAREDVPKITIGRLLKKVEPLLREGGIEAPAGGLSAEGARIAEKFVTPEVALPITEGVKQPWQMTVKEYEKDMRAYWERTRGSGIPGTKAPLLPEDMAHRFAATHQREVRLAFEEGKPIPAEVLADYPNLKSAVVPPIEVKPEITAVTEVAGAPPKPPKDWDKIGGQLYDKFKRQGNTPVPSVVPVSNKALAVWRGLEKFATDELAGLNQLGWQAELDSALVRASSGQSAQLYKETMKAITKSLDKNSELLTYVDDYLLLRHQLEVLKATGRKNFVIKKGDVTVKFTSKQIGLLFMQMEKELGVVNYAKVKEAASHVPAVYNQILSTTQELTPEQIDGLIRKYPWYNPILFEKETSAANIGGRLSPRQVKNLTTLESDKQMVSPLMSLPSTIAERIQSQAINAAKLSVANLAVLPKNRGLIGGDVEIVLTKPEGAFIDYFESGVRKYLKLGKGAEWIAKDIELFTRQPANAGIRMVRATQNLSKMAFTTYNPGFIAWNIFFDGMVTYFSEGIGPLGFGKALAGNIKGMFANVPSLDEFRRGGGEMMGFFEKGSMEGAGLTEGAKVPGGFVKVQKGQLVLRNPDSLKRFINPFELIRQFGVAGENAGRRATYEKAIKEGLSTKEAILRGRRVSVDFSRFSQASRVINDWYIYYNPAVQGLLLPGRAITRNPRNLWGLGLLVAAYAGLTLYNQSYEEYKDVRDSDKVGKLLFMVPSDEYDKYGNKIPHYITTLPMREFALFTAPIEYMLGRLQAEEPEAYRSLAQEWGVLYPVLSPLSMISESGGIVLPTQVGATIQQILQNHDDFRDRPIIDDEMSLLPPAHQYDQYTNKMAIRVGQALGMSPKKLDFFVTNMFGALGTDFLRALDLAVQQVDREMIDERIASLVTDLRAIPTRVPPNQIEITRETFLEGLTVGDRQLVLNMERLPAEQIPFITSVFRRFFRDYGGQVYQTAKEKALTNRVLEDYPPEALAELQKAANENANNLMKDKITKYDYDKNRTRYRAYYSGGATAQWREAMFEGAVSKAEVDRYMPESYQRSGEFQAVTAYMEIQGGYIDEAGGVLSSEVWNMIQEQTLEELRKHYTEIEVQYAIAHKDDWIDNLPEPARTVERDRVRQIEDGIWWDNYRGEPETSGGAGVEAYLRSLGL